MSNVKLFIGNRLENLSQALARVLDTPLASPMDEEIIILRNKAMEQWVSMELARRHGICANIRFYSPHSFINEILRKVSPGVSEGPSFDPEVMTWKIMKVLPILISDKSFERISIYLGKNKDGNRCFQLAERIADTFCQYLVFRPQMIFRWEEGKDNHWQARLWRELVKGNEGKHQAGLFKAFIEKNEKNPLRSSMKIEEDLPERISVFGISALPGFYMRVFAAISAFTRINLFFMFPCREYRGDSLWDQDKVPGTTENKKQSGSEKSLHQDYSYLEPGNSLFASMGTQGREFFDLDNGFDWDRIEIFNDSDRKTLLECIQSDILNLTESYRRSNGKTIVEKNDASIQIHSCHGPMREIEVLQDNLLAMFENDSDLKPGDILVMAPDIKSYAPYIQSVFDLHFSDPRRIPFCIADPSAQAEHRIIDNFFALLDLSESRFEASGVLSLLESQHIREKFGLSEKDFELIEKWVHETRIRWGIDGQSRRNLGLPGIEENTWKSGFSRLLLGYAMPGRQKHMFSGILPYDDMEGDEAEVLGKFVEFVNQIFSSAKSLEQKQMPGEWSDILTGLLENFFESDENTTNENTSRETGLIRRTLSSLRNISDLSGFDEKIDLNLIKNYLRQKFEKQGFGFGSIPGSVTFCGMSSMGPIPFKIICLVGMDSGAYPGESKPYGFDLMAMNPEPGDPSRRNDDRYLFLETLLSARQKLYISYMGQSIRDNSVIPPSVLVGEIMDYIEENFEIPGINIRRHILTKHRLQAFSPAYFKEGTAGPGSSGNDPDSDKKLFTYCLENFQAARSMGHDREHQMPFVASGLKEAEDEFKRVDLAELCRFFSNPAKFLINKRLGFSLEQGSLIPEEREAFEIKGLEKYLLEQMLMEKRLEGDALKEFQASAIAAGRLPHGPMGKCVFDRLAQGVDGFVHWIKAYRHGNPLEPLEVDLDLSGFRLTGRINPVYPERLIHYRYAKVKAKDILRIWIHHLVLNCMDTKNLKTDDYPETSLLGGLKPDGRGEPVFVAWEYPPVKEAGKILENLLEKYRQGLVRPLSFFPESSMKYARLVIEKNKPAQEALRGAENIWSGSDHKLGEGNDLYYQRCFGNTEPLDSNFEKIAIEIFSPILKHQKQIA